MIDGCVSTLDQKAAIGFNRDLWERNSFYLLGGGALVEHLKVLSFHSRACLRILFGEDPSIGPVWTHYSYGAAIERMRKQARLIRRGSEAPTNPSRTN